MAVADDDDDDDDDNDQCIAMFRYGVARAAAKKRTNPTSTALPSSIV